MLCLCRAETTFSLIKWDTKAAQSFEWLNVDFRGPLPSSSKNKYMRTIVDEFSRFPFVFPCQDINSSTVIKCLCQLFAIFGMPSYVHSDRGSSLISEELKQFFNGQGIATSRTSKYNPQGNGQCERYNGIVWKAVTLALKARSLSISQWEEVLPDALLSKAIIKWKLCADMVDDSWNCSYEASCSQL